MLCWRLFWKLEIKEKKIINGTNKCINSWGGDSENKYEYNNKFYNNCSNGFLNDKKCKCELKQCKSECPPVLYLEVYALNVMKVIIKLIMNYWLLEYM